jgi:hypothetical protein
LSASRGEAPLADQAASNVDKLSIPPLSFDESIHIIFTSATEQGTV